MDCTSRNDSDNGRSPRACVDVIIAAQNRAGTIQRSVNSALNQKEVATVIVVDDGSTDETADRAITCDRRGKRLIVERLGTTLGRSVARNVAIEVSTSPWLAILDEDDFFLPGRLGKLLGRSEAWDFLADDLLQVPADSSGCRLPLRLSFTASPKARSIDLARFVNGNITRRGEVRGELGFMKPLMRRSFLERHGLRYNPKLSLGEDYALYARALAAGARFLLVPLAGYVSLTRLGSQSNEHSKQDLERLRDSDCELMTLKTMTKAERRAIAMHFASVDCRVQWLALIEIFKSGNHAKIPKLFFRSSTVGSFLTMQLFSELCAGR